MLFYLLSPCSRKGKKFFFLQEAVESAPPKAADETPKAVKIVLRRVQNRGPRGLNGFLERRMAAKKSKKKKKAAGGFGAR